ncbi:calcium-binding protein [Miltoncostaea oceani]|uniref:calcium-binding protein n=1 Tax=Miltoncostaea oceani TaxID=2843216 RepID=UPI001C3C46F9|nr:hypothetical protein [Miltoncostaea oceani]
MRTVLARSPRLAVALAGLALVVVAGLLMAATSDGANRTGTPGPDVMRGTGDDDVLRGAGGADRLFGLGDDDRLYGGAGADRLIGGDDDDLLVGGGGSDLILARDGERDDVRCGAGRDRAVVDQLDRLTGCETVDRRTVPTDDDDGDDDD